MHNKEAGKLMLFIEYYSYVSFGARVNHNYRYFSKTRIMCKSTVSPQAGSDSQVDNSKGTSLSHNCVGHNTAVTHF